MKTTFEIFPVGVIRKQADGTFLGVYEEFTNALLGIEQFSHIFLFCWFEASDTKEKRATLRVHPRNDKANPLTGVFATRSPRRPNPIAVYITRIHGIDQNRIEIDPIDVFDGTPVIDIKPYIPISDLVPDATVPPWAEGKKKRSRNILAL